MRNIKNKARHASFFQKLGLSITLALIVLCSPLVAQNSGVLCVYWDSPYKSGIAKFPVFANSKEICRLKPSHKAYVKLQSNDYILQAKPNMKHPISVKVAPNDTFFVKMIYQKKVHSGYFSLSLMDKRQGKIESDLLKEMEK